MKRIATLFSIALLLAACGGGGGGGSSEVELNETQMQQVQTSSTKVVEAGAELGVLKTDPGNDNTFAGLSGIFGNASQIWSTKMAAEAGAGGNMPYSQALGALEGATFALTQDCWSEAGGTVTYDCTGAYGITGTVTVNGDNIKLDLTLSTQGYTFIYKGDITVTDTLIDGWLSFDYSIQQEAMNVDYAIEITYNGVTLDESGCAIGGSLNFDVDVDASGEGIPAGAGAAYDYPNVEVTFGPACGDIVMY